MKVLIACEFSGIVRDAFTRKGHYTWSCDLLPSETDGLHIQDDVLKVIDSSWDLMIAHPPCTYLNLKQNPKARSNYSAMDVRSWRNKSYMPMAEKPSTTQAH